MQTLSIEKFDPNREKLTTLANQYKGLSIAGVDDKEGYQRVHEARMELKQTRVNITKKGKELRSEAIAFQKNVIALEKDLVAIIEPIEKDLKEKQDAIDEEKERAKRVEHLPYRREQLEAIGINQTEEFLLSMDHEQFASYLVDEKTKYLEAKEAKLREEQEKVDAEKRRQEQAKLDAEQAVEREKELEKARKKAAKEAVEKERQRKEAEERLLAEKEAEAKAALEKSKKYQAFLDKHGVTTENQDTGEFFIAKSLDGFVLYKRVDTLKI